MSDTPVAVFAALIVLCASGNLASSVWLHRGPESTLRIHTRVAVSTLSTAAVVYAAGWGSLLMVAFAVGSAEMLRTAGPVTSKPNLWWNFIAIAGGQIAVEVGFAPSVVQPALSHAIAIAGLACLAIVTQVLGQSARATEAAEALLRERATHFEALIEHASDLIGVVSRGGYIVSVSPAVTPMLGYGREEVAGLPVSTFVDADMAANIEPMLTDVANNVGTALAFDLRLRHKDGHYRLTKATLTMPTAEWSDHIVINIHDITTQRDLEEQLRHDARHDTLTGLLNRKAFGEASERACARAARQGRTVGMLYIDLDGFKQVNDTFGHDAGDRVLIQAARRLDRCLSDGATLARLGGDEFAVLIDAVDGDAAIAVAEKMLALIAEPIDGLPNDVRVGASIGIALRSSEGIEISTLMHDADAAMYAAKRNGRSRWEMTGVTVEI